VPTSTIPPYFLWARCPSCRPTNSVKALKATSAFRLGRRRQSSPQRCYVHHLRTLVHLIKNLKIYAIYLQRFSWKMKVVVVAALSRYNSKTADAVLFVFRAVAFSALTLSVGRQEEHLACKNWVIRCWHGCVSSEVQMVCIWCSWCHCHPVISCFVKTFIIQIVLAFLVPAYRGCRGKEAVELVSCLRAVTQVYVTAAAAIVVDDGDNDVVQLLWRRFSVEVDWSCSGASHQTEFRHQRKTCFDCKLVF